MALSSIKGDMKELLEEKHNMHLSLGDASNLAQTHKQHGGRLVLWWTPHVCIFLTISSTSDMTTRKAMDLFSFAHIFHPIYGRKWINTNGFNLVAQLDVDVVKSALGALGPNILDELKKDFPNM
jgi:hypothetical protein